MSELRQIPTEALDMPCCPLCDMGMENGLQPVEIVQTAEGLMALAHKWCVDALPKPKRKRK